jgi:tRNA(fMet)-specific endonuclease VapC
MNGKYHHLNEFYSIQNKNEIKIPSVVLFELHYGAEKSQNQEKNHAAIDNFLSGIEIVPFNTQAAKIAGKIKADLEKKGQIIGNNDILIIATALANHGIIITNNVREFSRIASLTVEDWTKV